MVKKDREEYTYRAGTEKYLASMECGQLDWVTEKPLKEKVKSRRPQECSGKMVNSRISLVPERMGYLVHYNIASIIRQLD